MTESNYVPRPQRHLQDQQVEDLSPLSSAQRIIAKFGGVSALHRAFAAVGHKAAISQIYRWTTGPERVGTGGIIPSKHHRALFAAARAEGIVLLSSDFDPRKQVTF